MARYLYSELASTLDALKRLEAVKPGQHARFSDVTEWIEKHNATIKMLTDQHLPSGSGFDNGTAFIENQSHAGKLVFETEFHHMNESGYDGWTQHTVTVTPSFQGINIRISGRNRNDIKELIHQAFDSALKTDVTYDLYLPHYPQFAITSRWEDFLGNPSKTNQMWFVGTVNDRFMSYQFARDKASSLMVEASRKP